MAQGPVAADLQAAGNRRVLFGPIVLGSSLNNMSPALILHPTHVEFKALRTETAPYAEVELIDARGKNLFMDRRSTNKRFVAQFRSEDQLRYFVQLFGYYGCPLSPRAQQLAG